MDRDEVKALFLGIPANRQIRVLAFLAHNLTVCGRSAYLPEIEDDIARKRFRVFNELLHIVTSQLMHMVSDDSERYPDNVFMDILFEQAQPEGCEKDLLQAFRRSYSTV
jgi:hypothetical protein